MIIYKIFRADEWADLQRNRETRGAPIDLADGFIHFSTADQAVETAARHFSDAHDLWLAAIEEDALSPSITWEPSRGGDLFPHLYGILRLSDVLWCRPLPYHAGQHIFPEAIEGHIDPSRGQFDAFKALSRETPIEMLNLIRLRSKASYETGHPCAGQDISGSEAYKSYGRDTSAIVQRIGAKIVWRGVPQSTLIGPDHEHWDHAFIVRYPNAHAFLEMVTDAIYQEAVKHRQAAVRTSRLIRCAPSENGETFG